MKQMRKIHELLAEVLQAPPAQDPAARTRALSRLGPPRLRFNSALPA